MNNKLKLIFHNDIQIKWYMKYELKQCASDNVIRTFSVSD